MTEQPVVFITGASQGIGAETAKEFAKQGYHTLLLARNAKNLEGVADKVRQLGSEALVCAGDLGDLDFAKQSVDRCLDQWGRIDVLVNNATWRELTTMRQISLESWEKTLRVGLTAPAFLAQWCAVPMEAARRGVILNISSIQSRFASGLSPAYVTSKGGLDSLTYELATLYGPVGIRVLSLNLGAVETAGSADYRSEDGEDITKQLRDVSENMIPLGRWAQPDEIARSIVMFASDEAGYLTGESILIDGGWHHQCFPYDLKHKQFPQDFPATPQDRSP